MDHFVKVQNRNKFKKLTLSENVHLRRLSAISRITTRVVYLMSEVTPEEADKRANAASRIREGVWCSEEEILITSIPN